MNTKPPILAVLFIVAFVFAVSAQDLGSERDRHKSILSLIRDDIKKNYFDPTFKGVDLDAKYKATVEKLNAAKSIGQLSGIVAQFMLDFDDSHLFYIPPGKTNKTKYGFEFRMVGDKCFVTYVEKESDAEKKGLQVGDELYSIDGYGPTRDNLWKMQYFYYSLRPRPGLNLVAIKPDGKNLEYSVEAKIIKGKKVVDLTGSSDAGMDMWQYEREAEAEEKRMLRQYTYDKFAGVYIWKIPRFMLDPSKVDDIMGKARKSPALIIDLRGNGGGRVDMCLRLIANMFGEDVKVYDEKTRKGLKEVIAKSRGKDSFAGKLAVLTDSGSASASEIFSRVIQIEKRGRVFGDQSAGAVMEARFFDHQLGMDTVIFFGASVTIADLIMKDGKSLEKTGIIPDVNIVPTGKDIAGRRDVVMSAALKSLGLDVTPEVAGAIFPEDANSDR